MLLADITLTDILWSMIVFFFFFIWIMILFQVFGDLFRDHEESGAKKVLWVLFVIIAPFLGVLIYLIVRGQGMAQRQQAAAAQAQKDFNAYVQDVAGSAGEHAPPRALQGEDRPLVRRELRAERPGVVALRRARQRA